MPGPNEEANWKTTHSEKLHKNKKLKKKTELIHNKIAISLS